MVWCLSRTLDWRDLTLVICRTPPIRQSMEQRLFYCWYQAQGRTPHTPGCFKNDLGPTGKPLLKSMKELPETQGNANHSHAAWELGLLNLMTRHTRPELWSVWYNRAKRAPSLRQTYTLRVLTLCRDAIVYILLLLLIGLPIVDTPTGASALGRAEPGNNDNEEILHTP